MNCTIEVTIAIALSENGDIESYPYEPYHVQKFEKFNKWLNEKREDKWLWHIKYVKTLVLSPISNEEIVS